MRNCRTAIKCLCLFSVCMLFLASGCATPKHSNTLIFGTNTKFALDVSADPTGSPSVTIGYKRQEAIWMPLLANKDKQGTPAECAKGECLFIGTMGKDKGGEDKDTYSVLASFGAKFSGETTGVPKATGGLAQYFATGIAARKLAVEGGARLVAVQPADSELLKEFKEKGKSEARSRISRKIDILASVAPNDTLDQLKWETLIDKTDLEDKNKTSLKACKDFIDVNQRLDVDAAMNGIVIEALHRKLE